MTTTSTERSASRLVPALYALVGVTLAATVLLRLSAYGIWDPWELTIADGARKLNEGTSEGVTTLALRLVQASFGVFGTREWSGRLPMALSGLALLAAIALWVRRYTDTRSGLYAALVLGTTPFFLMHSREMVGATPAFLAAALTAIGACNAIFPAARELHAEAATREANNESASMAARHAPWLWLLLALVGALLGALTAGAMLTALPAIGAVACAALLTGAPSDRTLAPARRTAAKLVIAGAALLGVIVARTVFRHGAEYSAWTGGAPLDEAVPTFERVIAHVFHGFAPWSAAAPVALAALIWLRPPGADAPLRLLCTLWGAFAYGAVTIFLSTYGSAAFPAPAAIAIAIALWLRGLEERRDNYWPELVITLLMLGLLMRDYALYPSSPFDGLELPNATAPDKFNPKTSWSIVLGAFGAALLLSCMASSERGPLDLRAPYRGLRTAWDKSPGHRVWLVCLGLLWLGLVLFGVFSVVHVPGVKLTSLARRIGRVVGSLALLAPVLLALGQFLYHASSRLARVRNVPVLVAALAAGIYASQGFLPKLSAHFSPREVFDLFERTAGKDEPLAQYQVHGRAAAYYVHRSVRDIANEGELVNYLAENSRRWALLPGERLADVDVAFRRRTGRHLFLPSAENARVSLVANHPIAGQENENPLAKYVLRAPKPVQHTVNADFEGKIELLGYDLELPQKGYVGPGQTFVVSWMFRALRGNLGAYQAFLHVDAEGQRINGDHDPVDGMYPVRLWDVGDIVVDRQRVSVPATTPPGTYTMYVGFFRGETRLKVQSGPNDADRVIVGTIQIR